MAATTDATPAPSAFRQAVQDLTSAPWRPELHIEQIPAPQRIAPFAAAITADVLVGGEEVGSGRLVLLHDPDGSEAWDGVLRLVSFTSAELEEQIGSDPMLPAVGWSWLTGALDERGAEHRAVGGTVTQTTSTRFGDLAGPHTTITLEVRASWTADTADMGPHLRAFVDLLCAAAGLPPEGVAVLATGG